MAATTNETFSKGCEFCVDAGADFDWCRMCGRGMPVEQEPPESNIQRAVRVAEGHLRGAEIERAILATHLPGCTCIHHSGGTDGS